MGYMDDPLSTTLESHFKTIVLMLAEGAVPSYSMVMTAEINRFEKYLRDKRVNYTKKSVFGKQEHRDMYEFSLVLEEL